MPRPSGAFAWRVLHICTRRQGARGRTLQVEVYDSITCEAALKTHSLLIGALAAVSSSGFALAADLPSTKSPAPFDAPPQWFLTVGLGPEVVNQFPGSKTYTVVPNGYIYRGHPGDPEPFIAPDDGFTIGLLDYGWFKAGPAARYVGRRGLSDGNGNFFGLHNVDGSIELGGFAEAWAYDMFRAHAEVRQSVNGNHGLEANLSLDAVGRYGPWTLSAGPRFGFGNSTFMHAYYSVTPLESIVNGRVSPYLASGGFDSVGGLVSAKYKFSPSWAATVYGGYNRLVGSAGSSPISNNLGSKDEFSGGVTIAYTFAWGGLGIAGF